MPVAPLRNTSRAGVHPWTCPLHPVGLAGFVSLAEVFVLGVALGVSISATGFNVNQWR